jgi:hypothetical protein
MKVEIYNGGLVGTAEWRGPGDVFVDMADESERSWFEGYFAQEDSYLIGPVECAEMACERRDSSEEAFQRAAFQLAAYAYTVKR